MGSSCSRARLRPLASAGPYKSTGFETRKELAKEKERQGQNFLDMLNELSALEDFDEERMRRERRLVEKQQLQSSGSGALEVNSSDETSSQTLIGRQSEEPPDPGSIELKLIKVSGKEQVDQSGPIVVLAPIGQQTNSDQITQ